MFRAEPQPQFSGRLEWKQAMELLGDTDDDMRAFEATLSFVEEYASDALTSGELPALSVSSDVSNAFSLRLADDGPEFAPFGASTPPAASPAVTARTSSAGAMVTSNRAGTGLPHSVPAATHAAKPKKSTRKRKPQANPNRARNELRFELAFLREKVTQLQQELQALQPESEDKLLCQDEQTTALAVPDARRSRPSSQVLCAWKGVADRQKRRREDSERENARLRLTVEHQRKVAIDLSKLLRKRVSSTDEFGGAVKGGGELMLC
ncbi:unnamed protein product [Phytophthora fragariaefolia]|uniref:Unnamed protein product n=1 Tax=Phytophthora fragariaefolia TaxID=1490495 RepID=A0A9W7D0I0_9STRA|nr:unnamed protein product [Phytophthora fragariaefolia]